MSTYENITEEELQELSDFFGWEVTKDMFRTNTIQGNYGHDGDFPYMEGANLKNPPPINIQSKYPLPVNDGRHSDGTYSNFTVRAYNVLGFASAGMKTLQETTIQTWDITKRYTAYTKYVAGQSRTLTRRMALLAIPLTYGLALDNRLKSYWEKYVGLNRGIQSAKYLHSLSSGWLYIPVTNITPEYVSSAAEMYIYNQGQQPNPSGEPITNKNYDSTARRYSRIITGSNGEKYIDYTQPFEDSYRYDTPNAVYTPLYFCDINNNATPNIMQIFCKLADMPVPSTWEVKPTIPRDSCTIYETGMSENVFKKLVSQIVYYYRKTGILLGGAESGLKGGVNDLYDNVEGISANYTDIWWSIQSYVESNGPIFRYDNIENMYNYFNGLPYKPNNGEFVDTSVAAIPCDWTVYVKGAELPDMFVTMRSSKLHEYLDSELNTEGLTIDDCKVEWRGKTAYEAIGSENDLTAYNKESYIPLPTTQFDDMTIYKYGDLWSKEHNDADPQNAVGSSQPARLEFRLVLGDKIFSSWCGVEIFWNGNPNSSGFIEGNSYVAGLEDGSTVTIIYDKYPSGYYPSPDPSKPSGGKNDGYDDIKGGSDLPDGITKPTGYTNHNVLTKSYMVTIDQLNQLGDFLWSADFWDNIKLINNSPIENIVGCKRIPTMVQGNSELIKLGNVNTKIQGDAVYNVPVMNIGKVKLEGFYNNFIDLSPYTKVTIFLPFCGFYDLDASMVIGHEVEVNYLFDIVLGVCKALIFIDGNYYTAYDGKAGIDIPLVASNRAQVEAQFVAGVTSAVESKSVSGALSTYANAQYHATRQGSYSPTLGWQETRQVYVIIERPVCQYPSSYAHDKGFPCMLTRTLSGLSGYTLCSQDIDVSGIPCTQQERDIIVDYLCNKGVYL